MKGNVFHTWNPTVHFVTPISQSRLWYNNQIRIRVTTDLLQVTQERKRL